MKEYMKRMMRFVLLPLVLGILLSGCGKSPNQLETESDSINSSAPDTGGAPQVPDEPEMVFVNVNSNMQGIRILGERNLASDKQINCDWSCSGIEFYINNTGNSIQFGIYGGGYFRAYIDGEAWMASDHDPYYRLSYGGGAITLENVPQGTHLVRLVKATEYAGTYLSWMKFAGEILPDAPARKELYLEFVGDSITCGWGLSSGSLDGLEAYHYDDGTLAYPYLLARALDADYSVMAQSGQGLICRGARIPKMYLHSGAELSDSALYSFDRKPDLVVINIGTNDVYCKDEEQITEEAFRTAYRDFLNLVREKNGEDCKILCLYNAMNDTYQDVIHSIAEELGGEASGIWEYQLPRANNGEHPNIAEHRNYADLLLPLIKDILGIAQEPQDAFRQ